MSKDNYNRRYASKRHPMLEFMLKSMPRVHALLLFALGLC